MIPRLGDGNHRYLWQLPVFRSRLENDSPSRGRKLCLLQTLANPLSRLENDSPSRGRKPLTEIVFSTSVCQFRK